MTEIIKMPQVNVNDKEGLLGLWNYKKGDSVKEGDILSNIETSKEVEDLKAPVAGFFFPLVEEMNSYAIGEELAVIADSADYTPEANETKKPEKAKEDADADVLLTNKARKLVEENHISYDVLPKGVLLKEKDVEKYISNEGSVDEAAALKAYIEEFKKNNAVEDAILIAGAGTTAKIVIDTIKEEGKHKIFGIVDCYYKAGEEQTIMGIPVIAKDTEENLKMIYEAGITKVCNSVASLTNLRAREKVYNKLRSVGFEAPVIVHPTAFVEENAVLKDGVFVHAHGYVGSEAVVDEDTFVNTHAIVSHECNIGKHVFLAPNATVAGIVTIGDCSLIGMCATLLSRVQVGKDVTINNGAKVFSNIEDGAVIK